MLLAIVNNCSYAAESAQAESDAYTISEIKSQPYQELACARMTSLIIKSHYKEVNFTKEFEQNIVQRYINFTDYNRNSYLDSEVKDIESKANLFTVAIKTCNLKYPYELYRKVLQRRYDKYTYYLDLLKHPIDITTDETVLIDNSKQPFAKTMDELKTIWRKDVTYSYIRMLSNGKKDQDIRKSLTKRYKNFIKNLEKKRDIDAFSVFENAFTHAIDPHTSYLSPDDTTEFDSEMMLQMEGIGAVLSQEDDYVEIVSLSPGSPAELCKKLKPKDKIVGVAQHENGKRGPMVDVVGMPLIDVVPLVRGKKGTKVTLEIMRGEGASSKTFRVDVVRDKINLEESAAKIEISEIDGMKVGVLTIKSFYNNLSKDIKKELKKVNEQNVKALVIDLRNNGGGSLSEANSSTGLFLYSSPIVQIRDALGNIMTLSDDDGEISYDGSLVVLINRLSASASEIMASVLQDTGRAVIVGDNSFGKGTVQQSRPLSKVYDYFDNALGSVHYTISKFYRINGGSTQNKGVKPDILFPATIDDDEGGEAAKPNALEWDQIRPAKYSKVADLTDIIKILTNQHNERLKTSEELKNIKVIVDRQAKEKSNNEVSLNYEKFKARKDDFDNELIKIINQNLVAQGMQPVKNHKEIPDDYKAPDALLNEAKRVALELQEIQNSKGISNN
jgi:carboxyl-terminal processing protease